MKITATALSLTVADVAASSAFLVEHFGFTQDMALDGFTSLSRPDAGAGIVFLRKGLEVLPADYRHVCAAGLIVAFVVEGLEGEEQRLRDEGVTITLPLQEDPWGERLFQVRDPNGVVYQLVEWAPLNTEPAAES